MEGRIKRIINPSASDLVGIDTSKLTLWNKLGSSTEIQNSEVGPNGTVVGSMAYHSGKFNNSCFMNNAAYRGAGSGDYAQFSPAADILNHSEGCIEFWLYVTQYVKWVNFGSIYPAADFHWYVNGPWDNGEAAKNVRFYMSSQNIVDPGARKYLGFTFYGGNGTSNYASASINWLITDSSRPILLGEWTHVAVVWDWNNTLPSGNNIAFYINGVVETGYGWTYTAGGSGPADMVYGALQCCSASWKKKLKI